MKHKYQLLNQNKAYHHIEYFSTVDNQRNHKTKQLCYYQPCCLLTMGHLQFEGRAILLLTQSLQRYCLFSLQLRKNKKLELQSFVYTHHHKLWLYPKCCWRLVPSLDLIFLWDIRNNIDLMQLIQYDTSNKLALMLTVLHLRKSIEKEYFVLSIWSLRFIKHSIIFSHLRQGFISCV